MSLSPLSIIVKGIYKVVFHISASVDPSQVLNNNCMELVVGLNELVFAVEGSQYSDLAYLEFFIGRCGVLDAL